MTRDETTPHGRWKFDEAVTDAFDDMLERSVPAYDDMRQLVFALGRRFVQPPTTIVDLGASRGGALAPFVEAFGAANTYVAVEMSAPMRAALGERFGTTVQILDTDLRTAFPDVQASVILAVLTLQFVPIEHRQRLVQRAFDHLLPGGAFLMVEKVLGATALLHDHYTGLYHDLKAAHGYSPDAIDRKRLALEGVLVPVTARWNEDLLTRAGFAEVDGFWRWANFAGWIGVKR